MTPNQFSIFNVLTLITIFGFGCAKRESATSHFGGTDTSGGNVVVRFLTKAEIRERINLEDKSKPTILDSLRQALMQLNILRASIVDPAQEVYPRKLFEGYVDSEIRIFFPQYKIDLLRDIEKLSKSIFLDFAFGNEFRPRSAIESIKKNELHIRPRDEGACFDSHSQRESDASISSNGEICLSLERLSKKLTEENWRQKLVSLLAHEVTHYYGYSEVASEKVQEIVHTISDPRAVRALEAYETAATVTLTNIQSVIYALVSKQEKFDVCLTLTELESNEEISTGALIAPLNLFLPGVWTRKRPAADKPRAITVHNFCRGRQHRARDEIADRQELLKEMLALFDLVTLRKRGTAAFRRGTEHRELGGIGVNAQWATGADALVSSEYSSARNLPAPLRFSEVGAAWWKMIECGHVIQTKLGFTSSERYAPEIQKVIQYSGLPPVVDDGLTTTREITLPWQGESVILQIRHHFGLVLSEDSDSILGIRDRASYEVKGLTGIFDRLVEEREGASTIDNNDDSPNLSVTTSRAEVIEDFFTTLVRGAMPRSHAQFKFSDLRTGDWIRVRFDCHIVD